MPHVPRNILINTESEQTQTVQPQQETERQRKEKKRQRSRHVRQQKTYNKSRQQILQLKQNTIRSNNGNKQDEIKDKRTQDEHMSDDT